MVANMALEAIFQLRLVVWPGKCGGSCGAMDGNTKHGGDKNVRDGTRS